MPTWIWILIGVIFCYSAGIAEGKRIAELSAKEFLAIFLPLGQAVVDQKLRVLARQFQEACRSEVDCQQRILKDGFVSDSQASLQPDDQIVKLSDLKREVERAKKNFWSAVAAAKKWGFDTPTSYKEALTK